MNKKVNTLLFILGATVINIVLMIVLMLVGVILLAKVLPPDVNPSAGQIAFLMVFILSIVGSFLIYHWVMKVVSNRIDMDKYFDPIFRGRRRK